MVGWTPVGNYVLLHCRTEQAHENYNFKVIILQVNGESKKNNRKAESRLGISLQIIKLLR